MTELDRAGLDRILPSMPGSPDWDDVLSRSRARRGSPRRRLVALAVAALVVAVGTASAFGTVRDFFLGTGGIGFSSPVWSPDGRSIAYVVHTLPDGPSEVYVMNADGSGQRRVTRSAPAFLTPAWSPDGRKIVFVSGRRNLNVYVVNVDGSGQQRLARGMRKNRWGEPVGIGPSPTWSPNGRKVAFVSNRDGNFEVYVMNADGTAQRNLTRTPRFDRDPVWSPDGRHLAFVSRNRADGPPRGHTISVVNEDGGGQRMLARGEAPAWSPDGRKIAFRSSRDGNGEVYVMNADGSGLQRLTRNLASDGVPVWSPDGRRIAFVRFRHGNSDIYVVDAVGSGQRNLTPDARPPQRARDSSPAWSPDGRKILFVSQRDRNGQIYVMNADGSGLRKLTGNGG